MSDWYSTQYNKPRGLFDFLGASSDGGNEDIGAEFGDRMGVISQILMNLGSGKGGAGVGEAMSRLSERSTERQDRRQMARMANRMADKIEQTNPDLAAVIRSNHRLGLELAGKMAFMPMEFAQEEKIARMRGDTSSQAAIDLANRKAVLDRERIQNILDMAGLGGAPVSPSSTADDSIPAEDIIPNDPDTISLGAGEDEVQISPISKTRIVPAPGTDGDAEPPAQTAPEIPQEYLVGLPADKRMADTVLGQRLRYQDPEISANEVSALIMSLSDADQSGRQKYFDNIAKRKEVQARVREFATGANEMARQNQALPGINLQTPGQPELMQARIPLESVPLNEQPQAAEYIKESVKEGKYQDALERFLPKKDTGGFSVTTNPETGEVTVTSGGGAKAPTEGQTKSNLHYKNAIESMPVLDDPVSIDQLTSGYQPIIEGLAPEALSNFVSTDEFLLAKTAARNFIESVVRLKSGAQITPHEEELNSRIFIPRFGEKNKPKTIAFKKTLREAALQGIHDGISPQQILLDSYRKTNEAKAKGLLEDNKVVIPPMEPWAVKAGITQEQWNRGTPELWFPDIGER